MKFNRGEAVRGANDVAKRLIAASGTGPTTFRYVVLLVLLVRPDHILRQLLDHIVKTVTNSDYSSMIHTTCHISKPSCLVVKSVQPLQKPLPR